MNVQAVSRHHDCGLQRLHSVSDVGRNESTREIVINWSDSSVGCACVCV